MNLSINDEVEVVESGEINLLKDSLIKHHEEEVTQYVCNALLNFEILDSLPNTAKKLLIQFMTLTESDYGYFGKVEKIDNLKILIQIIALFDHKKTTDKALPKFSIPHSEFLLQMQPIFCNSNESISIFAPEFHPVLRNCVIIPLSHSSDIFSQLRYILFIGNRPRSFTFEFMKVIRPFLRTCEQLLENYENYQNTELRQKLIELGNSMKHSSLPQHNERVNKVSLNCFFAKDAVSWIYENGEILNIKSRVHAIRVGKIFLRIQLFVGIDSSSTFEDDETLFTFDQSGVSVARKRSGLLQFFTGGSGSGHRRSSSEDSSTKNKSSKKEEDKARMLNQQLRTIIQKKDYVQLRKKISKLTKYPAKKAQEVLEGLDGKPPLLHYVIELKDHQAFDLIIQAYRENTSKLNINITADSGYTALHVAGESDSPTMLDVLLKFHGIDPNKPNQHGNTPFHCFCAKFESPSSLSHIMEAFLVKGVDIDVQNDNKETPLHKAVLNPKIRLLLVPLLLKNGAGVHKYNTKGETPLHYAIHIQRKDLIGVLLAGGADVEFRASDQFKSPLALAKTTCSDDIINMMQEANRLRKWLDIRHLSQYFVPFFLSRMFLDDLMFVDKKVLRDLGVNSPEDQIKLLASFEEEKRKKEASQQPPKPGRMKLGDLKRKAKITEGTTSNSFGLIKEGSCWIKYSDLEFTEPLGSGTSGDVYLGYYLGDVVAIKVIEREKNQTHDFKHEFNALTQVKGPNIVKLIGASVESKFCLVMEYCSRGSVYDILSDSRYQFAWKEFFQYAIDMAKAVSQLHAAKILHRDIKSMNFLVTENWEIKICDFGLSRFSDYSDVATFYQLRGTLNYCAPDIFNDHQYTEKSDIFSFAIVLWEMLHRCVTGEHQNPFEEYGEFQLPLQIVLQVATKNLRPTLPQVKERFQPVIQLIQQAWDQDPDLRPPIGVIIEKLYYLQKTVLSSETEAIQKKKINPLTSSNNDENFLTQEAVEQLSEKEGEKVETK